MLLEEIIPLEMEIIKIIWIIFLYNKNIIDAQIDGEIFKGNDDNFQRLIKNEFKLYLKEV